ASAKQSASSRTAAPASGTAQRLAGPSNDAASAGSRYTPLPITPFSDMPTICQRVTARLRLGEGLIGRLLTRRGEKSTNYDSSETAEELPMKLVCLFAALWSLLILPASAQQNRFPLGQGPWTYDTAEQDVRIRVSVVSNQLTNPWSLAFLPNGD